MNGRLQIALALFIWLLMNIPATAATNLTKLVNKIRPAVVTVITYDVNHRLTDIGSGFFIDKYGHLITNFHVLEGKYTADVRTADGQTYPIKMVVADNKAIDLIKVLVDIPRDRIKWLKVSSDLPAIAEQVVVVGSPMGLEQTVSEGIVSSIRKIPAVGAFFQMSAPISPGSSGSPVINLDGQVVGVATFQMVKGQNLNFAVAANSVLKLKPTKAGQTISLWTFTNSLQQPTLAEKLCRNGLGFSINGQEQKALEFFKKATEEDPHNTLAWNGLGYCQVGMNNPQAAIAAYEQAIKSDPDDENLHLILADYYTQLDRYRKAIESYKKAIQLKPDLEVAYFKLGLAYAHMGQLLEGKKAFETVVRLNPHAAPAYFNIGIADARLGHYTQAAKAHQQALHLNPDFAPAYNNLGVVYGKMGEKDEEIKAYKEAIRVDPDFALAHFNLGYALQQKGEKAAALDEYRILKDLDKVSANKLFNLIYYPN